VTWEWTGEANTMADKVVAILRPRISSQRVAEFVENFYIVASSTMSEQATYAKGRRNIPYPAEIDGIGRISCGHNPWLEARPVSQLQVSRDAITGLEILSWKEPNMFRVVGGKLTKQREGDHVTYARRIPGSYFQFTIWDRVSSRFKPGWQPGGTPVRTDE